MAIQVFPHLHFQEMVDAFGPCIRRGVPVLQPVIVPSLPFSDYFQQRIAARFGISMGLEFLLPQEFVHRVVGPGSDSVWHKSRLVWQVLGILEEVKDMPLDTSAFSVRERYALALEIADQLDQYGHYRPEMIRSWANHTAEAGEWQQALWQRIRRRSQQPHPAEIGAAPDLEMAGRWRHKFADLMVIGSGTLDPLVVDVLLLLSELGCTVRVDVLLPSLGFLGDMRKKNTWVTSEVDADTMDLTAGHPLLASMGRQAVGTFHLLGRLDEQFEHWPEHEVAMEKSTGLLQRVQADIRAVQAPSRYAEAGNDISVHACFGPRREMEVLRDELLRAFEELPGLLPDEVRIITPEPEVYAPLVRAVMGALPVRLAEAASGEGDALVEVAGMLVQMAARGRFETSELWELSGMRATLAAIEVDEGGLDHMQHWIEQCGVAHGLGSEAAGQPGEWRFSRDRLLAGEWLAPGSRYPDGSFVLPLAAASDRDLRDRFLSWWFLLEETFRSWREPAVPAQWAVRLQTAVEGLAPDAETRALQPMLHFLRSLDCEVRVDAGVIADWLDAHTKDVARRTALSGAIRFGSMRQFQNIPCRVLALVGMQSSAFPRQTRRPAWDLLQEHPRIWDRNVRVEDRQMFLDALLTAKDRLIITASSRNMMTGVEEALAAPVEELLRTAQEMGAKNLVTMHPLQPFHPAYFDGTMPASYDENHARTARRIEEELRVSGYPLVQMDEAERAVSATSDILVEAAALEKFWRNPARAFLQRNVIGLGGDARSVDELDRVLLDLDGLNNWKVGVAMWKELLAGHSDLSELHAELEASRMLPPGRLGDAWWQRRHGTLARLAASLQARRGEHVELTVECNPGALKLRLIESSDSTAYLHAAPGKMDRLAHFFAPWISALAAAAAGLSKPTTILCENGDVLTLKWMEPDEARRCLQTLMNAFFSQDLLCFGWQTSEFIAKSLLKKTDMAQLRWQTSKKWAQTADDFSFGGDGAEPAQALAWRDRDPFDDRLWPQWLWWAQAVCLPMLDWKEDVL